MLAGKRGFTLLEMSIVITIMSILVGGGVSVFMASLQRHQLQDTHAKMHVIQKALVGYRVAFNRIPCPADVTVAIDDQDFGVEAENAGDCDGIPDANFHSQSAADEAPHMGMVPTKTLRLPDEVAFDGWGRRIMYAVSGDMTSANAFSSIVLNDTTERMTIKDAAGNAKTELAAAVLISFGPNGHGAFPRFGGTTRIDVQSRNTDELDNCDCTFEVIETDFDGVFVQKDPSRGVFTSRDTFDDVVFFSTRADLRTVAE